MKILQYFPKPFSDDSFKFAQVTLRCTPVIGFLAIYQQHKEVTVYNNSPSDAAIQPFLERTKEYSKSQKIAGIISIIAAIVLIVLGVPQIGFSMGFMVVGLVAGIVGLIHLGASLSMTHDDIPLLQQQISDVTEMQKAIDWELEQATKKYNTTQAKLTNLIAIHESKKTTD